jgi:hypothetical protein
MMKKNILPFLLLVLTLSSCQEEPTITIQNNVSNATLENVSWEDYFITNSLLPGEKSTREIRDKKSKFPKQSVVKFYMTRNGNKVYLETKQTFSLGAKENIHIVISDTTQVINPAVPI